MSLEVAGERTESVIVSSSVTLFWHLYIQQLGSYSVLTTLQFLSPYLFNKNEIKMMPRLFLQSFRNISQNLQIWTPSMCFIPSNE